MTASERLTVLTVSSLCTEMRAARKAGRTVVEAGRDWRCLPCASAHGPLRRGE